MRGHPVRPGPEWRGGPEHMERFGSHRGDMTGPWGELVFLLVLGILIATLILTIMTYKRVRAGGMIASPMPAISGLRIDNAIETVRMRYAKGEMSAEDFSEAMRRLGGNSETQT